MGNRTSAAKARSIERQVLALDLRRRGLSYPAIAAQLGIGKSQAHRLVAAGLEGARAQIAASSTDLKAEELSRLDGMLEGIWRKARRGDVQAIDRVLKIGERRARLLGLDAPVRTALEGGGEGAPAIATEARVVFYMPSNGRD